MSWDNNPCYHPEKMGLKVLVDIEWREESYEFDQTIFWLHEESKKVYMASDSGCSCPTPFEDYNSLEELTEVSSLGEARRLLEEAGLHGYLREGEVERMRGKIADAMLKLHDYLD